MRTGIVATLLTVSVSVSVSVSAVAQIPPSAATTKPTAPRVLGAAAIPDVEVMKYPLLAPAAHWGLRYLARSQYSTGGWGQKYGFLQPSTNLIENEIGKQKLIDPANGATDDGWVKGPLAFDKKVLIRPPTVVDTSLVTLAFLEAGRSPVRGDGAKELRRAIDFLHDAVGPGAAKPGPVYVPGVPAPFGPDQLPRFAETSGRVHSPALGDALAVELFLATRDRVPDADFRRKLDFTLSALVRRIESTQQDDGGWGGAGTTSRLADTVVTRALMIAARRGVAVDPAVIDRARQACLVFYDPATGDAGDDSDLAFVQCAMTLDVLYQTELTARAAVDAARPRAAATKATPAEIEQLRARRADEKAAHDALTLAVDRFYAKLFRRNKPAPQSRAKAVRASALPAATQPANPLDAPNPLDTAGAGQPQQEMQKVGIPVPVSHPNAVAYFLLLDALQESTHPLARPLADGIVNALAGKQDRFGQWHTRVHPEGLTIINHTPGYKSEDKEDHFLTAWIVRAILLPAPPEATK